VKHTLALVRSTLLVLSACGSTATQVGTEPLRYPALPTAPSGSTQLAAFDPAPGLGALTLACRAAELPVANALDDDCNGQVDDAPSSDSLLIAIAYPSAAHVPLALRSAAQQIELMASACDDSQAYCTLQLSSEKLARGRHTLLVRARGEGAPSPASVVVSVQSRGKVTTYLARLDDTTSEHTLGELALP
jgi:hypothetical protein